MVILDATITNVALPTIQRDLRISDSDLQWVVNSYTLSFGGLLLLGGRASDLLGRRRIFVPFTLIATTNVADEEAGLASGIFNTSQQIGGALGLAILSTLANDTQQARLAELGHPPAPPEFLAAAVDGFQTAFYAGAGLLLLGMLVHTFLLRRSDVSSIDTSAPTLPVA